MAQMQPLALVPATALALVKVVARVPATLPALALELVLPQSLVPALALFLASAPGLCPWGGSSGSNGHRRCHRKDDPDSHLVAVDNCAQRPAVNTN